MADRKTVLLAMSGGVDSSVAACLLLRAGYEVRGVHFQIAQPPPAPRTTGSDPLSHRPAWPLPSHADDAAAVARKLGVRLDVVDLRARIEPIIEHFAAEYARGRTPNPCARCNPLVKFAALWELADRDGIACLATGHYARVDGGPDGPALLRARCRAKDQSYFLSLLGRAVLGRLVLPLGELDSKAQVRELARELGLAVHDKPDSQEICFAGPGGYAPLLAQRAPRAMAAGDIVDTAGNVLGRHDGIGNFTIGQRRGVGVAAGAPMYVLSVDAASARVTIGPRERLMSDGLLARQAAWQQPVAGAFDAVVQVRHNHAGVGARVRVLDDGAFEAAFDQPVSAVTPGQLAAVYDGPRLLGAGWIERAWREDGL